jgi:hypothetical protein
MAVKSLLNAYDLGTQDFSYKVIISLQDFINKQESFIMYAKTNIPIMFTLFIIFPFKEYQAFVSII